MSDDTPLIPRPPNADDNAGQLTAEQPAAAPAKKPRRRVSTKTAAKAIEQRIGHAFTDPSLLATAFTHVSALKSSRNRTESYQRLEFLGAHSCSTVLASRSGRTGLRMRSVQFASTNFAAAA